MLSENSRFVSFNVIEKEAIKVRHGRAGLGRARSVRAGSSQIVVLHIAAYFFCSMDYVAKINTKQDMLLL